MRGGSTAGCNFGDEDLPAGEIKEGDEGQPSPDPVKQREVFRMCRAWGNYSNPSPIKKDEDKN